MRNKNCIRFFDGGKQYGLEKKMQDTLLQTQLQSEIQKSYLACTKQDLMSLLRGNVPIKIITIGDITAQAYFLLKRIFVNEHLKK